jgi:exonuclease SbcD
MIRVMHFADTHFGVETYGRLDPKTGLNTRLQDFKRSLLGAVETALDEGIDLALFAGDAYKTRDPRQTDQREFAGCIRKITDSGVPVAMLTGNHDLPSVQGRANAVEIYRTLGVTNVHVFSRPGLHLIETQSGPVRIAAMPFLLKGLAVARDESAGRSPDERRKLLEERYTAEIDALANATAEANDNIPTILLGHFWARGARLSNWQLGYFDSLEPQVPLSSLTNPAFDYVALGHIHRHQDLNPGGRPHVVYSGSPDRIDFGEKDEQKGFVLVQLAKGEANFQFKQTTEARDLLEIDVDADCDDPTERILEEIGRHSLRGAIVRLTYHVSQERAALVREREIHAALDAAFYKVAVIRKVNRDANIRNSRLTEALGPREALEIYIDSNDRLKSRRELLLRYAEPLFHELREHEEKI